jgi:hypothetical protein
MKTSWVDRHNTASPISIGCIAIKVVSLKNRSVISDDPVYDGSHTKVGRILEAHNSKPKNIKYKVEIQQKNSLSILNMMEISLLLLTTHTNIYFA